MPAVLPPPTGLVTHNGGLQVGFVGKLATYNATRIFPCGAAVCISEKIRHASNGFAGSVNFHSGNVADAGNKTPSVPLSTSATVPPPILAMLPGPLDR